MKDLPINKINVIFIIQDFKASRIWNGYYAKRIHRMYGALCM